jgi:hypothetical protein
MMKVLMAAIAIATGMTYAAPAYAAPGRAEGSALARSVLTDRPSDPGQPVLCVTPPAGAPLTTTPQCHDCIMAHLFDRDGLYRECLGGNPN